MDELAEVWLDLLELGVRAVRPDAIHLLGSQQQSGNGQAVNLLFDGQHDNGAQFRKTEQIVALGADKGFCQLLPALGFGMDQRDFLGLKVAWRQLLILVPEGTMPGVGFGHQRSSVNLSRRLVLEHRIYRAIAQALHGNFGRFFLQ